MENPEPDPSLDNSESDPMLEDLELELVAEEPKIPISSEAPEAKKLSENDRYIEKLESHIKSSRKLLNTLWSDLIYLSFHFRVVV